MAKRATVYTREKRKKELLRQKKREEKRQRHSKRLQDTNDNDLTISQNTEREMKE